MSQRPPPGGPPPWVFNQNPSAPLPSGLAFDRAPIIIGVVTTLYSFTVIAIVLRLLAKYLSKSKLWWDDYLALTAWAFYTVKACCTLYSVSPAVGGARHIWMVTQGQLVEFLKLQSITFMMYPLAMGAAKCSILFFYIKLFGIARWFRYWCYFLMALAVGWAISLFIATLLMCIPIQSAWDIFSADRDQCIDPKIFFNSSAMADAILNFMTLIAPLYSIWHLKLSVKKKVAISGFLLLGAGELIFTILRVVVWRSLAFQDVPWDFYPVILWTNIQESIGVVCICLPALAPLVNRKPKKNTAQYNYSATSAASAASKKRAAMGTVTSCQSSLDEKDHDDVPLRSIKRTDSSIANSSFVMDADEKSI